MIIGNTRYIPAIVVVITIMLLPVVIISLLRLNDAEYALLRQRVQNASSMLYLINHSRNEVEVHGDISGLCPEGVGGYSKLGRCAKNMRFAKRDGGTFWGHRECRDGKYLASSGIVVEYQ